MDVKPLSKHSSICSGREYSLDFRVLILPRNFLKNHIMYRFSILVVKVVEWDTKATVLTTSFDQMKITFPTTGTLK